MAPLAIDLFCGLGGWTEGLLEEGYRVVGFDIEQHVYGEARYPAQLVLQDVLTLHGAQFKDAALIVASPPCQAYSYRAMPWKRAKALPPPDNALFAACFRIQREACAEAGRFIPLVVENVCGAQPWVGRARWHHGSFYLWGDVPALMPVVVRRVVKRPGHDWNRFKQTGEVSPHWRTNGEDSIKEYPVFQEAVKNVTGGSWFAQGNGASVEGNHGRDRLTTGPLVEGYKGVEGKSWIRDKTKDPRPSHGNSVKRKAASAQIAKIPLPLSRHIARAWYPEP